MGDSVNNAVQCRTVASRLSYVKARSNTSQVSATDTSKTRRSGEDNYTAEIGTNIINVDVYDRGWTAVDCRNKSCIGRCITQSEGRQDKFERKLACTNTLRNGVTVVEKNDKKNDINRIKGCNLVQFLDIESFHYAVQDHSTSPILIPIESLYAT